MSSSRSLARRSAGLFVRSLIYFDARRSVLAGLPQSTIMPLQRVQNAAAWLILDLRMNDHVTPVLRHLHYGYRLTYEWISNCAPCHHDAFNPQRAVSVVLGRHGSCLFRQTDEVRSAIRRNRPVSAATMSHRDWQAGVFMCWPSHLKRSSSVTQHHQRPQIVWKAIKAYYFTRAFGDIL